MFLLSLVDDVVASLFCGWISTKGFGTLDSAICNKKDRLTFLELIHSNSTIFIGVNDKLLAGPTYFKWLGLRRVKASRLRVCDLRLSLQTIFEYNAPLIKLKHLRIEGIKLDHSFPYDDTARQCVSLEEFILKAPLNNVDTVVTSFVQLCPKLLILSIDTSSQFSDMRSDYLYVKTTGDKECLTSVGLLSILRYGTNLTHLKLSTLENLTLCKADLDSDTQYNGCAKLIHLDLGRCSKLTDNALHIITKHCTKLEHVYLHLCQLLTDKTITYIAQHNPTLKVLNLAACNLLGDAGMVAISQNCANFEAANLNATLVTDNGISALAQGCSKLTRLKLKHNENITSLSMDVIAQYLPKFEAVGLGTLTSALMMGLPAGPVSAHSLTNLVNVCGVTLNSLDLTDCADIDSTLQVIGTKCVSLKWLFISICAQATEETMLNLVTNCTELTYLEALGCSCITDSVIVKLAETCTKLTCLNVSHTTISDLSLQSIATHSKLLSQINIDSCKHTTTGGVVNLIENCANLTKLHCYGVLHSTLILEALIEHTPFISDVTISRDESVSHYQFIQVTSRAVGQAFPRVKLCYVSLPIPGFH